MEEKICTKCGKSNEGNAKFCTGCAEPFLGADVSEATVEAVDTVVVEAPVVEAPVVEVPVVEVPVVEAPVVEAPVVVVPVVEAPVVVAPKQTVYTETPQQVQVVGEPEKTVPTIAWIGLFLLKIIPLLGVIIEIIIAMTSKNKSLRNYGKARLILLIIGFVLFIAVVIFMVVVLQDVAKDIMDVMEDLQDELM
jgi:uncharacterized membrane protein